MVVFPKLDELIEQPKDLWFGYYPYSMGLVYNESLIELRTHSKKNMTIESSFPEEEHSLHVAWDPISPCKDSLPPTCTQICKEIKIEGL